MYHRHSPAQHLLKEPGRKVGSCRRAFGQMPSREPSSQTFQVTSQVAYHGYPLVI